MTSKEIDTIADVAVRNTKLAYMEQGHNLTGKGAASIRAIGEKRGNDTIIQIVAADYVVTLNRGVPANRIPYSAGSGATTSLYISGLQRYAKLRFGLSDKEALSVAFQIARKQKEEGMPTLSSQRFSRTGKRTGFVNEAIRNTAKELAPIVGKIFFKAVSQKVIEGR